MGTTTAEQVRSGDTVNVANLRGASESYRHPRATIGEIRRLDGGQTIVLMDTAGRRIATLGAHDRVDS